MSGGNSKQAAEDCPTEFISHRDAGTKQRDAAYEYIEAAGLKLCLSVAYHAIIAG